MENKNEYTNPGDYKVFNQLVKEFYYFEEEDDISEERSEKKGYIHIEPKIIYNKFNNVLKLEIRIGEKQFYKIKSLPEFYDRFLKKETYRYGAKLEFEHIREMFLEEDRKLLDFVLKYAEIIKYANEASTGYDYYTKRLGEDSIVLSNSGIDELFNCLENKAVIMECQYNTKSIVFVPNEPDIKFSFKKIDDKNYKISTDLDIYEYTIYNGKDYVYILIENNLYKCSKKYSETVLKILEIYRKNFTRTIKMPADQLSKFFSIVEPNIKNNLEIDKDDYQEIKKYIPAPLYAKLYLDYNEKNYVLADIKFVYDNIEINPLDNQPHSELLSRETIKEAKLINMFVKSGFMLDQKNNRLILADEEKIYKFLTNDINSYMKNFEILATDNFREKEVKGTTSVNLGVRIENNLLDVDLSNLEFNADELQAIMEG